MIRLSVIIPVLPGFHLGPDLNPAFGGAGGLRAQTERAVQSILSQHDPIGTEIIVVDDQSREKVADHLIAIFGDEIAAGRLRVLIADKRSGDLGKLRNWGASLAQGSFLTFLDPKDHWLPGRLMALETMLTRSDLILTVARDEAPTESTDWIQAFLRENPFVPGTLVVRHTLFDEVEGFPEGYGGLLLPRKIPGALDFEFSLQCVLKLVQTSRKDRVRAVRNVGMMIADPLDHPLLAQAKPIRDKVDSLREAVSLLHLLRKIPRGYFPSLVQRLTGFSGRLRKGSPREPDSTG